MKPLQGVNDFNEGLLVLPCAAEIKKDGWGIFARREAGGTQIYTIHGHRLDLPHITRELDRKDAYSFDGFFLHGELTHPDGLQHIKGAIAIKDERLVFNIFDMVDEGFFVDKHDGTYSARRARLEKFPEVVININIVGTVPPMEVFNTITTEIKEISETPRSVMVVPSKVCHTLEDIHAEYEAALEAGEEGIIIKRLNSRYNSGKTLDWLRLKPTQTQDCEIVDYTLRPGTEQIKSLDVVDERGIKCTVGTGISEHDREMYAQLGDGCLGMIVEVKHRGRFDSGCMRHATYSRLRDDRPSRRREEHTSKNLAYEDVDIDALKDKLATALDADMTEVIE